MAAYAEGLNILKHANAGNASRNRRGNRSAARPEHYQYDFNLADVTEVWRRGSVVASWLLDLTAISLSRSAYARDVFRPRFRFRRRPLDHHRRHRVHHPGAGAERCALSALRLAGRRRFRRQNSVRHALSVWWARREKVRTLNSRGPRASTHSESRLPTHEFAIT